MATTLLGLLCCAAQEAVLVGVFTAVLLDTRVFEGTEDGVRSVVLVEVFFVFCQFRLVVLEFALC